VFCIIKNKPPGAACIANANDSSNDVDDIRILLSAVRDFISKIKVAKEKNNCGDNLLFLTRKSSMRKKEYSNNIILFGKTRKK